MVERVGPAVDPSRVGERVWIWYGQWKRPFGTAATYIALPSEQAVRLPDGTTFEAGACLGIPALTAHRALTIDPFRTGCGRLPVGRGVDRIVEVDIAGNATLVPKIIAQGGLCAAYGSEGRCHRDGERVVIYYAFAKDTLEPVL